MENILKATFNEFNKKVDGNYYVCNLNKEIQFAKGGSCGKVCDLRDVEIISFGLEEDVIFLEANESWILTTKGPEF